MQSASERGARGTRLSRELILATAATVVQQEGLEALSMRRLGQELDVWPMSVYRHFRDKGELLDALAQSATAEVTLPGDGTPWRAALTTLLGDARAAVWSSGDLGHRLPRAFLAPTLLRISDAGLHILARAGFEEREAASAWWALWSYTFGFATFALDSGPAESARRLRAAVADLAAGELPVLTSSVEHLAAAAAEPGEFDYGLERLLDGLEARLARAAGAARGGEAS